MIMSPSMSLVAAGVASGICFILLSTIRKGKTIDSKRKTKEIQVDDSRCACCLKPFLIERGVRCNDCSVRSCRKGCSRWDTSENAWHCLFCHQRRLPQSWLRRNEKWFETFGGVIDEEELHHYFSTAKSRVYVAGVENAATSSTLGLAAKGQEETNTMETVRDFVEKIVEGLIGNVDDTPIDRLYEHPAYDKLLAKYTVLLAGALARLAVTLHLSLTNKPSTDSPTMAHTALREIVERAVEEARKLPGLGGSGDAGRTQEGRNIAEHSYEDLLATAILNKVIEKFQREQVDGNSNVLHGKTKSTTKCTLSESELGLDEGVEEGSSSLEPFSQDECSSDCSASRSKHIRRQSEPLSLTIEERIEEVTTTYTSDEDHRHNDVLGIRNARRVPFPELGMDIIDPSQESSEDSQDESETPTTHVDLVSPIESWEENWLFQKKKVQAQPDPVAMLVPNSSADYKALIGDKDAEDTSDLSECSSAQSDEEIEKELMEAINNVVPRSPRISESENENKADRNMSAINDRPCKIESKAVDVEMLANGENRTDDSHGSREGMIKGKKERMEGEVCQKRSLRNQSEAGSNGSKESTEECEIRGKRETKVERDGKNVVNVQNKTKDSRPPQREITENPKVLTAGINVETPEEKTNIKDQTNAQFKSVSTPKSLENEESAQSAAGSKDSLTEIGTMDSLEYSKAESIGNTSNNTKELVNNSFPEENVDSELPKTPNPTPTRNSVTENSYEEANISEIYISNSEVVLNSLERAKKKLMGVDDAEREEIKEKNDVVYKLDFHGDDEAQQESEYTEHYDIATQRHLDSLTKIDQNLSVEGDFVNGDIKQVVKTKTSNTEENRKCREAVAFAKAESASYQTQLRKTADEDRLATPPRPGTIAEREHKKWENAAPIENNPYSEESIQRRLFERQYSRRSADIPGVHTELPKSNGADLETVLEHNQPDITRFGRDYYINNSKLAYGDRTRRSTTSASSRPSSSLSQLSNSTGADHEQQEEVQCRETELIGRNADVKSKVAKWQKNNDSTLQSMERRNGYCTENAEEKYLRRNGSQRIWEDRVEDILEYERKNSKNEINAKLNNRETTNILETKKSFTEENQRKIRRIDLKAYGFENEFSFKTTRSSPQRVVNKLDLKSFGYDGGLRRTQSNNHLDSTVNNTEFKPRVIRVTNKSNLTRCSEFRKPGDNLLEIQASGDRNWTKSTETLNKLLPGDSYTFGTMTAAKSVPDIARCEYYSNNEEESEQSETESTAQGSIGVQGDCKVSKDEVERSEESTPMMQSENETDESSSEKGRTERSMEKLSIPVVTQEFTERNRISKKDKKLPLPSVRLLAEAFSKQPENSLVPAPRVAKSNGAVKERSSTPEIHIVETPRQMHSLTARSLSKKFREGLRQIPNKVTSPPASHVTMERICVSENQTEVVQSKGDGALNDIDVISPGKLKSNIIFWEQMQKRS